MSKIRNERLNSELQRALSEIITNDLRNPIIDDEVITILNVDCSQDMSYAKVFINVFGTEETQKKVFEEIVNSKGYIKKLLAKKVQFRILPELEFKYDKAFQEGSKVMNLIDELKRKGEL